MLESRHKLQVLFKNFKVLNDDEYVVKLANSEIIKDAIEGYSGALIPMEDN